MISNAVYPGLYFGVQKQASADGGQYGSTLHCKIQGVEEGWKKYFTFLDHKRTLIIFCI